MDDQNLPTFQANFVDVRKARNYATFQSGFHVFRVSVQRLFRKEETKRKYSMLN